MSPKRVPTRTVRVGSVLIGSKQLMVVQSMTNTKTDDIQATNHQIKKLAQAGCELVRVAVPDEKAVKALSKIVTASPLPVVADIHFDYKLALRAIDAGVAKIRINPGNMGLERSLEVAAKAATKKVAMRIGVNGGSISEQARRKVKTPVQLGQLMAKTALQYAVKIEKAGCEKIILSVKASNIVATIAAYRLLAEKCDYPLHLGITEAGGLLAGSVKTAAGLSPLLLDGIGDTIRVSLTGDPVQEIQVANMLLSTCGVRQRGVEIIACPTCGRTLGDLSRLLNRIEKALQHETRPLTIAVMGCIVNGPGEARHADVGIAGSPDGHYTLFSKGKVLHRVSEKQAVTALLAEVQKI